MTKSIYPLYRCKILSIFWKKGLEFKGSLSFFLISIHNMGKHTYSWSLNNMGFNCKDPSYMGFNKYTATPLYPLRFHNSAFSQPWTENSKFNPWLGTCRCGGQNVCVVLHIDYMRDFLYDGLLQKILEPTPCRYQGTNEFWGEFSTMQRLAPLNPCIVQGSTVLLRGRN